MAKLPHKITTPLLGNPTGIDYGAPVRTIKQVNAFIHQTLTTHLPGVFCIQGEISNFRVYERGHAFFTLKEPGAEIPCICWKDRLGQIPFKPQDGQAVIARGSIRMYEPQGKIQLYVEALYPQGTGALELAFRQLCQKLKEEGLFEAERKRPIPRVPQHVVIMTSRTGDVLHDVLTTAYRRFPGLHSMLYPIPVQGPTAAPRIVEAIKLVNAEAGKFKEQGTPIDLILLVRGGGALEDLWPFNEEAVARAIVASKIPIATGIGHEPDTTIADLVGDLRGPTPTGVTELTIPEANILRGEIEGWQEDLHHETQRLVENSGAVVRQNMLELSQALQQRVRLGHNQLEIFARQVAQIEPRHAIAQGWRRVDEARHALRQAQQAKLIGEREHLQQQHWQLRMRSPQTQITQALQKLDQLGTRLRTALNHRMNQAQEKITATEHHLKIVSPQAVLERGFSITQDHEGKIIRDTQQVNPGDVIETKVANGSFKSTVGTLEQGSLF